MRRRFFWQRTRRLRPPPVQLHIPHIDGRVVGGLLGVVLAVLAIRFVNGQVRPVMTAMATAQVQNAMTLVIDGVVAAQVTNERVAYDDIIQLEVDATGAVTALKSDMSRVNLLRAEILSALVEAVDEQNLLSMGIPLGNLTGVDLLSGRGPEVPVRVITAGSADAQFENAFSAAGINQTRHQVMLNVAVPVRILMPGHVAETQVSAQVCVAETVIVGRVPDTYLQFGSAEQGAVQSQGSERQEIAHGPK